MNRTVTLHRVGSDPELLAVQIGQGKGDKLVPYLIPATTLVGNDREGTLRSFIGCDGHAATMELRPPPCHNVQWHLIKIADGLDHIHRAVQEYGAGKPHPSAMLAQPGLNRETCGGHIWISLYYNSELSSQIVHQSGFIWNRGAGDFIRSGQQLSDPTEVPTSSMRQRYRDLAAAGEELSIDVCWLKLHYLLEPLEMSIFTGARDIRAATADPYWRLPNHQRVLEDPTLYRPGRAYFRFEYRFPTTWLSHPAMALSYLGLAKLAILNWDSLPSLPQLLEAERMQQMSNPPLKRAGWVSLLLTRLQALKDSPQYRTTNDLRGLDDAIQAVTKVKLQYPLFVDHRAWQQYNLNQRG